MDLLKGVRVIDLSELAPGPFCTMLLADMGADVIKVERPKGDPVRRMIPGVYEALNRNKRSIVINLKNKEGRSLLFRLIEKADVFIVSYRPGVLQRLGVSYEKVKSINEGIIYCSISGYGQNSPYRNWPGHDINYCAVAGISSINGRPAGPPEIGTWIPIADYSSSLYACISILSMLYAHRGGYLDVSITDCALSLMITRVNEYMARGKPSKEKFVGRGGYGIFRAKDGKYLAIALVEEHFWRRFCQLIGHEDMAKDGRFDSWIKRNENMNELNSILDKVFVTYSRDKWVSLLAQADVPCSPVNFINDIPDDPHIKARRQIEERKRDGVKISNILFPTLFDGKRLPLRSLAPSSPGQDADQILTDTGINKSEIERLRKSGAIV